MKGLKITPYIPEMYRDTHKDFLINEIAIIDAKIRDNSVFINRNTR